MDCDKQTQFDYIIVGAGSAGSALANKLSQCQKYSVLLLEQGASDGSFLLKMPKGFGAALAGDKYVSRYTVDNPSPRPFGEVWLRGKTLGGSSSVNGMIWAWPQPHGFKALTKAGGEQWSWANVVPYLQFLDGGDSASGIIPVRAHTSQYSITKAFVDASCATGLQKFDCPTSVGQVGSGFLNFNINDKGERVSASTAFLKPLATKSTVYIKTHCQVKKVLFKGTRATSILCNEPVGEKVYTATRDIILCAGTLESPQILQRSGIGPRPLLEKLNIPVIIANPNVGENLREHLMLGLNFEVKSAQDTENKQYSGFRLLYNVVRYMLNKSGPMSQSPCHAATFIKSDEQLHEPDIQIMLSPFSRQGNGFSQYPGISIAGYPIFPKSKGNISISSALISPPIIKPNYLQNAYDKRVSVIAARAIRNIVKQEPLASMLLREMPLSEAAQSDAEIIDLFHIKGQSGYHAVGTCAMGESAATSVVDSDTCVHGVTGLRVVDCSIYPQMLAGVSNALTMAIALRAADLILKHKSK